MLEIDLYETTCMSVLRGDFEGAGCPIENIEVNFRKYLKELFHFVYFKRASVILKVVL